MLKRFAHPTKDWETLRTKLLRYFREPVEPDNNQYDRTGVTVKETTRDARIEII